MGNTELRSIDEGRRSPGGRRDARFGQVLGIVGTVFLSFGGIVLLAHRRHVRCY